MAASPRRVKPASGGLTSASAQRRVGRAADSTKAPQHRMPVSGAGPLVMRARTDTTAVTGPPAWENGRDQVATNPAPRLTGAGRMDCNPYPASDSDGDSDGD